MESGMMTMETGKQIARDMYDAYNDHDWDGFLEFFTDNCKLTDMAEGKTYTGKVEIREYYESFMESFSDGMARIDDLIACGENTVAQWSFLGKNDGPIQGPMGDMRDATNKSVDLKGCDICKFQNNKVSELTTYYDQHSFYDQLGFKDQMMSRMGRM